MAQAFQFISSKEVVVAPWNKKPDIELVDPSGDLLTVYLDVTLPALLQDSFDSRSEVFRHARRAKAKEYPRKDDQGRLINQSGCIPFILTSMGGLCAEGRDFLRICRKRNPLAAQHLVDVLVTQHSRWSARRIRRALFGQSLIDFSGTEWTPTSQTDISDRISFRGKGVAKLRATSLSFNRLTRQASNADASAEGSSQDRSPSPAEPKRKSSRKIHAEDPKKKSTETLSSAVGTEQDGK
jgi:hypothetical protein